MPDAPRGHTDWAEEDTKNPKGHPPDKDEHPEIPHRPHDEEPPAPKGFDEKLPPEGRR